MSVTLDGLLMEHMDQMDNIQFAGENYVQEFFDIEDGIADDEVYAALDYDPELEDESDPDYDNDPETGILDDMEYLEDDEMIDDVIQDEDDPEYYDYDDEEDIEV